jgi:hypothetical protein
MRCADVRARAMGYKMSDYEAAVFHACRVIDRINKQSAEAQRQR